MSEQPGLLRRLDRTGVPLVLGRLILGVMFLSMGLAKTGVLKTALAKADLAGSAPVMFLVDHGLIELSDPVDFLKLIREYEMVPENVPVLMNSLAAVLPWVEVLCGLLLIVGVAVRGSALLLVVMLIGFTAVLAVRALGIYHSQFIPFCDVKFDCGCGAGEVYICRKLPENIGLCLLAVVTLLSRSRRFCLWGNLIPARASTPGG